MKIPIALRYRRDAARSIAAFLLPGSDPAAWLGEIDRWPVDVRELRLHPLPSSEPNATAVGCLVVLESRWPRDNPSHRGGRAVPYGRLGPRVYLPIDADVTPSCNPGELLAATPGDATTTLILHPRRGAFLLSEHDALRVADLIVRPGRLGIRWDHAEPGQRLPTHLISVEPTASLEADQVIDSSQDDIGEFDLEELAESPEEPSESKPVTDQAKAAFAKAVRWMTSKVPGGASQETWVDRVEQWADRQLARRNEDLFRAQHREILRLLDWLAHDPERGLRHALPLNDLGSRGLAPASDRLSSKRVDFDLAELHSNRGVSPWDAPPDLYRQLRDEYLRLADEERRAGRARRAAYIHAHLLGDLESAASVLRTGGHLEEAAALYRHRLGAHLLAAECYAAAGLTGEALSIYEELSEYERAAELCTKLGQKRRSHQYWRRAVDECRARGELVAASALLADQLDATDEAIELLEAGWRTSRESRAAFATVARLYGEEGHHDRCSDLLRSLTGDASPHFTSTVAAVVDIATRYPHDEVQRLAAETVRRGITSHLQSEVPPDPSLIRRLGDLRPADRLLQRDTVTATGRAARRPRRTTRPATPSGVLAQLPVTGSLRILPTSDGFVAIGHGDNMVLAYRAKLDAPIEKWQRIGWNESKRGTLIAALSESSIALAMPGGSSYHRRVFPTDDTFSDTLPIGTPPGWPTRALAADGGTNDLIVTLVPQDDDLFVRAISPLGESHGQVKLPTSAEWHTRRSHDVPVSLVNVDDATYVTVGSVLYRVGSESPPREPVQSQGLLDGALALTAFGRPGRRSLAIAMRQGGAIVPLLEDGSLGDQTLPFGEWQLEPAIAALRHDTLVSVAAREALLIQISGNRLSEVGRVDGGWTKPVGVVSTADGGFVVVDATGEIYLGRA